MDTCRQLNLIGIILVRRNKKRKLQIETKKIMGKKDERIDAYIANAAPFAQPILTHLRDLIHEVCPDVEETWKWSFPNFDFKGASFVSMASFKNHCALRFWRGSLMEDPDNIFNISENGALGSLNKISALTDLPDDSVLIKYLSAAVKLSAEGKKAPKMSKPKTAEPIKTPDDLAIALTANEAARNAYNNFSNSHKKEYIEWIEEAKTLTTRNKRIAQAVEMIGENKSKNWKYK
jgi:uncharacterized protein YdeI (YjbR/CyaY-like superfamily)